MKYLIDTHCHISFDKLIEEKNEIIEKCKIENVKKIITIACEKTEFEKSIELTKEKEIEIYTSLGIHPCNAKKYDSEDFLIIEKQLEKEKNIVAIGETGFDFFHEDNPNIKIQTESLERQIEIAKKFKKPLVIHLRNAQKEAINFFPKNHNFNFVLHCYLENWDFAKRMLDLGCMISFSGVITFKNCSNEVLEVVKKIPKDRFFLETDSPFLAPHPFRGKINKPHMVKIIAEKISEIRNENLEDLIIQTTKNAERFFDI